MELVPKCLALNDMKQLLTLLILLLAVSSEAVVYQNWFVTNPPVIPYRATNTTPNRGVIYVRDNASALVNGTYYQLWYDPVTLRGVWTNSGSTNIIWQNEGLDASIGFTITSDTNKPTDFMASATQVVSFPGISTFWINPMTAEPGSTFGGTANMFFGTNYPSTNILWVLNNSNNAVLPNWPHTNGLWVSPIGNDLLGNRTNGYPYKTLAAANAAMTWGDVCRLTAGTHFTTGIHMRPGTTILGEGINTVVFVSPNLDQPSPYYFQSPAIVPWDNCEVGNMVLSNGCIAIAQFQGSTLGGTNVFIHDLWIYPPYLIPTNTYPSLQAEQYEYWGGGVIVSRVGSGRMERVRVYSAIEGFVFQSMLNSAPQHYVMKDCEAICSPEYNAGISNTWLNFSYLWPSIGNVGGMMPIAFRLGDPSAVFNASTFTLDIDGGAFVSINGSTNAPDYIGGENNISRNACIWISKAYTNFININFSGAPQFIYGTTNASYSNFILNETTNGRVTFTGGAQVKPVVGSQYESATNTFAYFGPSSYGTVTITNGLLLATNYNVSYFTPIQGYIRLVASNNAVYSVSVAKTNLIVTP